MGYMPDGNSAALRAYEREQDRLARKAPTDSELEEFVEEWIETRLKEEGADYLAEIITEAPYLGDLYKAVLKKDEAEVGYQFMKIVDKYLRPKAEEDAAVFDFEEYRMALYRSEP